MTAELLMALMMTMRCESMVVNIPERRETIVHTMCVRVQPVAQVVPESAPAPVVKKAVKKKKKYRRKRRRR